jgi:hypothetical protein
MKAVGSKRALLGWEMGGGLGHIRRLIGIGRALREHGWQPSFVLRDTDSLADEVGQVAAQVFKAPAHARQLNRGERFNAVSYADFMAVCGYRSPTALAESIDGWDRLIGEIKPDLILADYAPLLHLAAFGRLPLIVVGSGFTVPPCEAEEFPRLRSGGTPLAPAALLVENARSALHNRTCELPKTLTQIMAGQAQFVSVPPMLDVYGAHRTQPADGALDDLPDPLPALTSNPGAGSVFFYLAADFPGTVPLLRDIAATGQAAEGFLRSADPRLCSALRAAGINVHEHPVPLDRALSQNAVIVHHGGIGTTIQALALGRPQLILHRHMEQHFNAHMLARLGIAKSLNPGAAEKQRPCDAAFFDLPKNAASRARTISENLVRPGSMNRLVALCDALVG